MHKRISSAILLLVALMIPTSAPGAAIDISSVELTAFGSFSTQLQPVKIGEDRKSAVFGSLTAAEVLITAVQVNGMPFPGVPTSQTQPFASSRSNANGEFGVGVNGFFFQNSLPPNTLLASGSTTVSFANNSGSNIQTPTVNFFVPAPTIRFLGVGESTFPAGADPARDAIAVAVIDLVLTFTLANGSKHESILVDYGLEVSREPLSKVLFPFPRRDGVGQVTRFDEFTGAFGFTLPDMDRHFAAVLKPGESVEFASHYTAQASTGFGETGVFAAIGDPFNISTGGGRFSIQAAPGAAIPEPGTLVKLSLGLAMLAINARRVAGVIARINRQ